MNQIITFPGLGLSFTINPVAFTIFGLQVKWYGILFAAAFLLAVIYVLNRTRTAMLDQDRVIDVLMGAIVFGFIGARLYFVFLSWDQYKDDLMEIFKVWNGGIAMYGGVIGALISGYLLCRWRKVPFLPLFDLCAPALLLAQAIGRWGNFVNGEAFGSATAAPWRMLSKYEGGGYYTQIQQYLNSLTQSQVTAFGGQEIGVHPTFFYESVWCLAGFLLLAWFYKKRRFDGEMMLLYFAWYGAGRAVIEGWRTDSLMLGNIRVSQVFGLLTAIAAVVIWLVIRSRIKNSNDPEYLMLYAKTDKARLVLEQAEEAAKTKTQKGKNTPAQKTPDDAARESGEEKEVPPEEAKSENEVQKIKGDTPETPETDTQQPVEKDEDENEA